MILFAQAIIYTKLILLCRYSIGNKKIKIEINGPNIFLT